MYGFDIGTTKLKVAHVEKNHVKRLFIIDLPEGLVSHGEIKDYTEMGKFLKDALKSKSISGKKEAAVVIAPGLAFVRNAKVPLMTTDQLLVNLPFEFRDYLTDSKDAYSFDYLVNGIADEAADAKKTDLPSTVSVTTMDLTVATALKETVRDYASMFKIAGFTLKIAVPSELALYNVLRAKDVDSSNEYCFVDIGQSASRMTIFTGSKYETTRNIEICLNDVDKAIARDYGTDVKTASDYKIYNLDNVRNHENATNVYNSISNDIRKAVNFYAFNNRNSNLDALYLMGGGAHITSLREMMSDSLEMKIHSAAELLPGDTAEPEDGNRLDYVLAAGAAMQKERE